MSTQRQVQCAVCGYWYPGIGENLSGMDECPCGASVNEQLGALEAFQDTSEPPLNPPLDPDDLPEPAPGDVEVADGFLGEGEELLSIYDAIAGNTELINADYFQTIASCIQETVTAKDQLDNLKQLYTALGLQSVWELAAAALKADREWEDEDEENLEALFDPGSP